MPNYNITISNGNRDDLISYIIEKRKHCNFTVIDVGGSMGGWSSKIVDAIIDFNEPTNLIETKIKHFKCDITNPDDWINIHKYIEINGKFDFCICTHTLEDIMNPVFVSKQIEKIAISGYIAVPSKYRELSRFESDYKYRGYIHHRWIFDMIDDNFIGYPKINYIDSNDIFDKISDMNDNKSDLSFYWINNINIFYLNNNYLGPNINSVIKYYNKLITNDV